MPHPVIQWFAEKMEEGRFQQELNNDAWWDRSDEDLIKQLEDSLYDLRLSIKEQSPDDTIRLAADTALFAMFLADKNRE